MQLLSLSYPFPLAGIWSIHCHTWNSTQSICASMGLIKTTFPVETQTYRRIRTWSTLLIGVLPTLYQTGSKAMISLVKTHSFYIVNRHFSF
jgi:hypothetical protein